MGELAIPLILAGTGISAAAQLQAGAAAESEAESRQNIANYNAALMEREAKAIEGKTEFEQKRQAEAAARTKSRLRARLAATGAVPDIGTPLLIQEEQAEELELENILIGYEGQVAAAKARSQAELDRLTGRIAVKKGKAAKKAGFIGAGATLLTGFGTAFTPKVKTKTSGAGFGPTTASAGYGGLYTPKRRF